MRWNNSSRSEIDEPECSESAKCLCPSEPIVCDAWLKDTDVTVTQAKCNGTDIIMLFQGPMGESDDFGKHDCMELCKAAGKNQYIKFGLF